MKGPFSNILISKLRHLGDVLTTTPLIPAIRREWPRARISYLVNPGCEDLIRFHPEVYRVLTVPRGKNLITQWAFIRKLRSFRFDLALELSNGDRGAFLTWICGAGTRVGYRPKRSGMFNRRLYSSHCVMIPPESMHTVDYHLEQLRLMGVEPGFQPMSMCWPPEAEALVRKRLADGGVGPGMDYAVVHPVSRWMCKAWRPEGNARVADYLADAGLRVVLTSAPNRGEMSYIQEVLNRVHTRPLNLAGDLNLPELAALINGARIFFGVDSLPMHMAAAVGTPVVALFGPSGEHMWGPWGKGHQVVAKDWPCRPCGRFGCDDTNISRCLVETEAHEVYPFINRALAGRQGEPD